jgi:phage regulator Rha-like protein
LVVLQISRETTTATTANTEMTMSSREIAEVVEARHDNVKIAIDRLRDKGLVTFTAMQEPTPGGGKPRKSYYVNKRDSYVIVAQLSPEFTARLVDRWQELEKQQEAQPQVPQSFADALRLADDNQEKLEQAEQYSTNRRAAYGEHMPTSPSAKTVKDASTSTISIRQPVALTRTAPTSGCEGLSSWPCWMNWIMDRFVHL